MIHYEWLNYCKQFVAHHIFYCYYYCLLSSQIKIVDTTLKLLGWEGGGGGGRVVIFISHGVGSVGIDFPVLVALRPRPAQLSSEREQWPGRPSSEHRPPTPGDTTQPDCLHHIHCPGHPATTTLTTTTTTTTLPHGGRNWQCFLQSSSPRLSSSFSHSYRIILWGEGGGGGQVNWFGETTHHTPPNIGMIYFLSLKGRRWSLCNHDI